VVVSSLVLRKQPATKVAGRKYALVVSLTVLAADAAASPALAGRRGGTMT
jgi:hypothetical protein